MHVPLWVLIPLAVLAVLGVIVVGVVACLLASVEDTTRKFQQ